MALPDYHMHTLGTAVIWGEAGATGISLTVTDTLSFDALANDAGRMGASVDLGVQWDREQFVQLIIETGTAPIANNTVELYLACCHDNTNWPGGVTGSDAAYKAAEEDEWKKQLGPPASILVCTADGNTVQKQQPEIWIPTGRYVTPVVINKLGQAVRDETTATDNDSRVVLVPRRSLIQDT
jgi:hypothetical protein